MNIGYLKLVTFVKWVSRKARIRHHGNKIREYDLKTTEGLSFKFNKISLSKISLITVLFSTTSENVITAQDSKFSTKRTSTKGLELGCTRHLVPRLKTYPVTESKAAHQRLAQWQSLFDPDW